MNTPLAVVTVTYNPGRHLTAMLESLDAATTRDTVVILADNDSRDTAAITAAAAHPESVIFHPTGGNIGYGAGMNSGIARLDSYKKNVHHDTTGAADRARRADTEFVLITNPDVQFAPGSIDALIECARRHPGAGAVGPAIFDPDGTAYPSARQLPDITTGVGHALLGAIWKNNPFTRRYLSGNNVTQERSCGWLSGSCLLVRRAAFDAVGGFDERYFMYMEDVDLGDRLGRDGWTNMFCPTARVTHDRGHVAGTLPATMLPAHHASAYRYQADRHPGWRWLPLRIVLRVGLKIRSIISVTQASRHRPATSG